MSRPILSWQEWLAAVVVVTTPYVLHWWSVLLAPVVFALVSWGAHRRLSGLCRVWPAGHRTP